MLNSVIISFLKVNKNKKTLISLAIDKQFCFPESPDVSRDEVKF